MTRENQIKDLMETGVSYAEIGRRLGLKKNSISHYAKKFNCLKPSEPSYVRYNWEEIEKYHKEGHTLRQCMDRFGFCKAAWTKAVNVGKLKPRTIIPIEELLVSDRTKTCRGHLKIRLLKSGLLKEECCECGIIEWRGKKLSLQLHHKNGINKDNKLENLCLICPNCHSQTENFSGKNRRK